MIFNINQLELSLHSTKDSFTTFQGSIVAFYSAAEGHGDLQWLKGKSIQEHSREFKSICPHQLWFLHFQEKHKS